MTIPADVKVMAVLVVRDGQLPAGAAETVAEAGGTAVVAGSGTGAAADGLEGASRVWLLEVPSVAPAALARSPWPRPCHLAPSSSTWCATSQPSVNATG